MSERATVDLRPAFAWDCESCGRENFARAMRAEMSPEDMAEMREEYGVEFVDGEFLAAPLEVTCAFCNEVFDALDDREAQP